MTDKSDKPQRIDWNKLWQDLGKKANKRPVSPEDQHDTWAELQRNVPQMQAAYDVALSHFASIIVTPGELLDEHVVDCIYSIIGPHIETATLHQIEGMFQAAARMYQSVMACAGFVARGTLAAGDLTAMRATNARDIANAEADCSTPTPDIDEAVIDSDATRDAVFAQLERYYTVPEWAKYEFRGAVIQFMQFASFAARIDPECWAEAYGLLAAALVEATNDGASNRQVTYYPDKSRRR